MPKWKYTLDFSHFYRNDALSIKEKAAAVSADLKALSTKLSRSIENDSEFAEDLDDLAESFLDVEDAEEFDYFMSDLYDVADMKLPDGRGMIWIKTF